MWISIKPLKKKMSYKKATQYKKNYIGGDRSFFYYYGKGVYVEVLQFFSHIHVQKYNKIGWGNLVKSFGSPPNPPNLEGSKIEGLKGRGGNILGPLPSNFSNQTKEGSLPFPQTKQALKTNCIKIKMLQIKTFY